MNKVTLVPHHKKFAQRISALTSAPQVKDSLGLSDEQISLRGTIDFIEFVTEQETIGKQYSRVILNEEDDLIGVITLKDINITNKTCHIGTWIGYSYWGKGYNEISKKAILYIAFTEFGLEYVFVGAKLSNIRSQKAQEKLPYIRIGVQSEFPDEHQKLELQVNEPCILNLIERDTYLKWYMENK